MLIMDQDLWQSILMETYAELYKNIIHFIANINKLTNRCFSTFPLVNTQDIPNFISPND